MWGGVSMMCRLSSGYEIDGYKPIIMSLANRCTKKAKRLWYELFISCVAWFHAHIHYVWWPIRVVQLWGHSCGSSSLHAICEGNWLQFIVELLMLVIALMFLLWGQPSLRHSFSPCQQWSPLRCVMGHIFLMPNYNFHMGFEWVSCLVYY